MCMYGFWLILLLLFDGNGCNNNNNCGNNSCGNDDCGCTNYIFIRNKKHHVKHHENCEF
jgi:hypothetical protein